MEWRSTKSDNPDLLCSAEFTSRYPETNEKVFSELMANEMADEWEVEPSVKSRKVRIYGNETGNISVIVKSMKKLDKWNMA